MATWKKIVLGIVVILVLLTGSFFLFIGPWPIYAETGFRSSDYYRQALADIDTSFATSSLDAQPGVLKAGWGVASITPPVGVPMAGYGDRRGAPSEGVRDELFAKALALSDGVDTVVLVGSDMLLVPPNVAELVREKVAQSTPLTEDDILFHASHTHCGPGGWAPGVAAKVTGGAYDESIPPFLADAFSEAIVRAYEGLEAAKLAHGAVDAPQYIKNRTREAPVDSTLHYLVVEQADGDTCYLTRYSAHPTVFGGSMREFSAEYPGEIMGHIERETGATAIYLGGAVGSMGYRAPEAPSRSEKVRALGMALGQLILDAARDLTFEDHLDVASMSVDIGMPPMQVRPLSPGWRLSRLAAGIMGVELTGRVHGARVGEVMFFGVPFDLSGEVSRTWQQWAARRGLEVWPTGFSSAYCGYLSPDTYYTEVDEKGHLDYEIGLMNWFGPNTEAYITELFQHSVEILAPAASQAGLG